MSRGRAVYWPPSRPGRIPPLKVDAQRLVDLAVEALRRSGFSTDAQHPEDFATALVPAIEAVAVGMGAAYRDLLMEAASESLRSNGEETSFNESAV